MKSATKRIIKDCCIIELGTFDAAISVFDEKGLNQKNNTEQILTLLELNILLEAICLYDKVLIPYQPEKNTSIEEKEQEIKIKNEFANSLFNSKIVSLVSFKEIVDNINSFENLAHAHSAKLPLDEISSLLDWRVKGLGIHKDVDYKYFLEGGVREVEGEKQVYKSIIESNLVYTKLIEEVNSNTQSYYFPGVFNTLLYSGKPDMKKQLYNLLSEVFKEQIINLKDLGFCTPIYIPPISTLVLSRANSKDNMMNELIGLRSEFNDFRDKYNNYQDAIRNPEHLSLKELHDIRKDNFSQVYNTMSRISERKYTNLWFELFTANLNFPSDDNLEIKGGLNFLSLIKLATKGIQLNKIEGKASILFDVYTRLGEVKKYHKIYKNTFNLDIQKESMDKISRYSHFVNNYISVNRQEDNLKTPDNNV